MSLKIHADTATQQTIFDLINYRVKLGSLGMFTDQEEMKKLDAIWKDFRGRHPDQTTYQKELLANCTQIEAPGKAIEALLKSSEASTSLSMNGIIDLYVRQKFASMQLPLSQPSAFPAPSMRSVAVAPTAHHTELRTKEAESIVVFVPADPVTLPMASRDCYLAAGIDLETAAFLCRLDYAESQVRGIEKDVATKRLHFINEAYKKAVPRDLNEEIFFVFQEMLLKAVRDLRTNVYFLTGFSNLVMNAGDVLDQLNLGHPIVESNEGFIKLRKYRLTPSLGSQARSQEFFSENLKAILHIPMRLAHTYILIKAAYRGKELDEKMREFFCLNATSINAHWENVLTYSNGIRSRIEMIAKCGGMDAFEKAGL